MGLEKVMAVSGGIRSLPKPDAPEAQIPSINTVMKPDKKDEENLLPKPYEIWSHSQYNFDVLIIMVEPVMGFAIGLQVVKNSSKWINYGNNIITVKAGCYTDGDRYICITNIYQYPLNLLSEKVTDRIINDGYIRKRLYQAMFGKNDPAIMSLENQIQNLQESLSKAEILLKSERDGSLKKDRKIAELEARHSNNTQKKQFMETEIRRLQDTCETQVKDIEHLKNANATIAKESLEKDSMIAKMKEDIKAQESLLDEIEDKRIQLERENSELKNTLKEKEIAISKLESQQQNQSHGATDESEIKFICIKAKLDWVIQSGKLSEMDLKNLEIIGLQKELEILRDSDIRNMMAQKEKETPVPKPLGIFYVSPNATVTANTPEEIATYLMTNILDKVGYKKGKSLSNLFKIVDNKTDVGVSYSIRPTNNRPNKFDKIFVEKQWILDLISNIRFENKEIMQKKILDTLILLKEEGVYVCYSRIKLATIKKCSRSLCTFASNNGIGLNDTHMEFRLKAAVRFIEKTPETESITWENWPVN